MNKRLYFFVMVLCLALSGCIMEKSSEHADGDGGGIEITNGKIYGTIFNPDHSPAAFATVTFVPVHYSPFSASGTADLIPDSVTANERGQYRLDTLPQGFYNILSKHGDGMAYLDSVYITDDYATRVDDTLEAPSSIIGVARLEGDVTDHSSIIILVLGTQTYAMTQNDQGEFTVPQLAPGKYRLRFLTTVVGYGYKDTLIQVSPVQVAALKDTVVLPLVSPQQVKNVLLRYDKRTMGMQLSWPAANPSLIRGYNVYRAVGLGQYEKLNNFQLTDTIFTQSLLAFEGQSLTYSVASVDLKGRESGYSSAVSVLVESAYSYEIISLSWDGNRDVMGYDFGGDGNLYICDRETLYKFDKSGGLLLELTLEGMGNPPLPKSQKGYHLQHSAQGYILIQTSEKTPQDSFVYPLHKLDEEFKYLGKLTPQFLETGFFDFKLSASGDIYLYQQINNGETHLWRMDFDGTVHASRVLPHQVRLWQVLNDTVYINSVSSPDQEPNWLTLDRDLKDIATRNPAAWLSALAGPDSINIFWGYYHQCPSGLRLASGAMKLPPPAVFDQDYFKKQHLSFVSLFDGGDSLLAQFPTSAFFLDFMTMDPDGNLIFYGRESENYVPGLFRYKDTIPGSGIVMKTAWADTLSVLPATPNGKIGSLTGLYDPKTMHLSLSWSLFDKKDGLGYNLYRTIDDGQKELLNETFFEESSYQDQLMRYFGQTLTYTVAWVDKNRNEFLIDEPVRIAVSSALAIDSFSLDLPQAPGGSGHMGVHWDGSLFLLDSTDVFKFGPGGEYRLKRSLDVAGSNFNSFKALDLVLDGRGRVIVAVMGRNTSSPPPFQQGQILIYRFNSELVLQDSLVLDVEKGESQTFFYSSPSGELYHHADLRDSVLKDSINQKYRYIYKTRVTVYDTSFAVRKTVDFPMQIWKLKVMRDTVFVEYSPNNSNFFLLEYYDLEFNALGRSYGGLSTSDTYRDILRLSDGRCVMMGDDLSTRWNPKDLIDPFTTPSALEDALTLMKPVLFVAGPHGSLMAKVPLTISLKSFMVPSLKVSPVYIYDGQLKVYIVDIGPY